MARLSPSLSALTSAHSKEKRILELERSRRQVAIDTLSEVASVAFVELDKHIENKEEEKAAKEIAESSGYYYNPELKTFTKNIEKDNVFTPVSISLDDMKSYKEMSLNRGAEIDSLINLPSIKKMHTISREDISTKMNEIFEFNPNDFTKKTLSKNTQNKAYISSLFSNTDPQAFSDFEMNIADSRDLSTHYEDIKSGNPSKVLGDINEAYNKQFGSIDEYFEAAQSGDIEPLSSFGRMGDKHIAVVNGELAHISKEELYMKQIYGDQADKWIVENGAGTINPDTGFKEYAVEWLAIAALASPFVQMGMNAWSNTSKDMARVKNIGKEIKELDTLMGQTKDKKVSETEEFMEASEKNLDAIYGQSSELLGEVGGQVEELISGQKGLKTGEQELVKEEGQTSVMGQVEDALDTLETQSQAEIGNIADTYDQQVADAERQKTALERERDSLEGGWLYKARKWKPFG